ncbi:MAG: transposase [Treponema sp.]|nr:transposase [Treponema sp.]
MQEVKGLPHSVWEREYHVVWIPKYRRKKLYGELGEYPGELFHELARQKESKI